jgi:hypothetical protein
MNKFNPKAKCSKCGHTKIRTWYCNNILYGSICYDSEFYYNKKEHLHRGCERCHFEWLELCLDNTMKGKLK